MELKITQEDIKKLEDIVIEFEKMLDRFLFDTNSESDLQTILRAHLYIEHELENILQKNLMHPELLQNKSRFIDKVRFIFAMGILPHEDMDAIIKINTLRNLYAHKLDYLLNDVEFTKILDSFSTNQKIRYEKYLGPDPNVDLSKKLKIALFTIWITLHEENFISKGLKRKLEENKKMLEENRKLRREGI